jgi:hypothetical protein
MAGVTTRRAAARRGRPSARRRAPRRARAKRRSRSLRAALRRLLPSARTRQRWMRAFRRWPPLAQIAAGAAAIIVLWAIANGVFQVVRKPTELFFPVSGTLFKTPSETWSEYAPIFRRHATAVITPEFLAALAQTEASGNPIARTYWRWSWVLDPFEIYRPASSAVGMYQITDGTFEEASRYCIHDHRVVEEGPWHAWRSCWLNELYFRVVPSHAVELTSAYLDRGVARTLARHGIRQATVGQKQNLAALIHLCGLGAGNRYAQGGLRLSSALRCGDHAAKPYVERVASLRRVFAGIAARDD